MRLTPLVLLPIAAMASAGTPFDNDRGPGLPGSRQGETVTWEARDFDRIGFGIGGAVEVKVGPAWSVTATGPAAAFDAMRIVRERGTLSIGNRYWNHQDAGGLERQVRFTVTLPRLTEVAVGGSGTMTVDRVEGGTFTAAVGGSGDLTLQRVAVDAATVSIGGSGDVFAAGTAQKLTVGIGGSGNFQAPGLRARNATIATAGSGRVRTTVDGTATVSTVGSGNVDVSGGAKCVVSRMGSAQVRCGHNPGET